MVKPKFIQGRSVNFEVMTRMTPNLREAMDILDQECSGGPGGTFSIVREKRKYVAHPHGPFESVVFDRKVRAWKELD